MQASLWNWYALLAEWLAALNIEEQPVMVRQSERLCLLILLIVPHSLKCFLFIKVVAATG
jgi:hypothetical protein